MILRSFLPLLIAASLLAPRAGSSQTASTSPPAAAAGTQTTLTALTQPTSTWLRFDGPSRIQGAAPLELPPTFQGRFSLVVEGATVARTQGVLYVPPRGFPARLVSEPRGFSGGLIVRSLSYPGLPNITAKRPARGLILAGAATGGIVAAGLAHLDYRDRLDEFGGNSGDRALDKRRARNSWVKYAGATWALSAVDYWIRPRLGLEESTPSRVTLSVPTLNRTSIVWRSVLVPGAGQDYANHRARGALWLGATLAAAAGFVVADNIVEEDQTEVDWAETLVDSAGPSELLPRLQELEVKRNDLQSSEDLRRGLRYATIGVYLAGVIDAFLVPTQGPATKESRVSASFAPLTPNGPTMQVNLRF
ncbi:MAG TPA: hypothetical protein VJW75_00890 [Candidatus Eisenbacteria bacterium]|nr:hypothetical protein [Candidatus Eisenbacteria bacterium]